jgi:hypothetical protein
MLQDRDARPDRDTPCRRRPEASRARRSALVAALASAAVLGGAAGVQADTADLLRKLNAPQERVTEGNRAWRPLFEAVLAMTPPPQAVGSRFNQETIWPGMPDWSEVAAWAAANEAMGKALVETADRMVLGLPYGKGTLDSKFADGGLYAEIVVSPEQRVVDLAYLRGIDLVVAYAAAEMYRLGEAGEFDAAFALGIANAKLLRKVADREMVSEKIFAMTRLARAMSVQRDFMWTYRERIPAATFQRMAIREYPFLRPTDNERLRRLELPEGDRLVAEATLQLAFDDLGQPITERFEEIFADLQTLQQPLTRFGAAKRWRAISNVHGSLEASQQKLTDIYDDWWRRWRMRAYDPLQDLPIELDRTNEVRYAAVLVSILDIQVLFELRRLLIAEINGTILAAGLCGYERNFGVWPDLPAKYYAIYAPKRFDYDPYDRAYGSFLFRFLGSERRAVDTPWGRVWATGCMLWARGEGNQDDGGVLHDPEGRSGDLVLWPPLRALARQEGLIP